MLVIGQNDFLAYFRIGEADAAWGRVPGDAPHGAALAKLFVRQTEQVIEVCGRQSGDAETHEFLHLLLPI
jgi:hypothetical protein